LIHKLGKYIRATRYWIEESRPTISTYRSDQYSIKVEFDSVGYSEQVDLMHSPFVSVSDD